MIIPLTFSGKTAIVTGAGRGLGKAIVRALAQGDGKVFALSKTQEKLEELKAELPQVTTIRVDVSDYDETRRIIQSLGPVDMLVNNAAINIPGPMLKISRKDFEETMNCNVLAALNITQVVAENMISSNIKGSMVQISSIAERICIDRQGMYGISKIALSMMNKCFCLELGKHGIRLNAVSPALFPSDMSSKALNNPKSKMVKAVMEITPLGRIGTVDEIVNAVLFLLHDSSSYINGQSLFVCGGGSN